LISQLVASLTGQGLLIANTGSGSNLAFSASLSGLGSLVAELLHRVQDIPDLPRTVRVLEGVREVESFAGHRTGVFTPSIRSLFGTSSGRLIRVKPPKRLT
jgi:hypothetical protein